MRNVIEFIEKFIKGLLKTVVAVATAFFAVVGAAEYIDTIPFFSKLGENTSIGLGIVYFLFVLAMVIIGIDCFKTYTNEKGKKK